MAKPSSGVDGIEHGQLREAGEAARVLLGLRRDGAGIVGHEQHHAALHAHVVQAHERVAGHVEPHLLAGEQAARAGIGRAGQQLERRSSRSSTTPRARRARRRWHAASPPSRSARTTACPDSPPPRAPPPPTPHARTPRSPSEVSSSWSSPAPSRTDVSRETSGFFRSSIHDSAQARPSRGRIREARRTHRQTARLLQQRLDAESNPIGIVVRIRGEDEQRIGLFVELVGHDVHNRKIPRFVRCQCRSPIRIDPGFEAGHP